MKTETALYQFKAPFERFDHFAENKLDSYRVADANGNGIATLWLDDRIEPANIKATAQLFAAAPDLLAALIGAQSALRKALPFLPPDNEYLYVGEWLDEVNEAIAKVTA